MSASNGGNEVGKSNGFQLSKKVYVVRQVCLPGIQSMLTCDTMYVQGSKDKIETFQCPAIRKTKESRIERNSSVARGPQKTYSPTA